MNFEKYPDGLMPVVVQDSETRKVLMLGYMNRESLELTRSTGRVTFYSRSRQSIWTKGESSGNFLHVREISPDCDQDAILILAKPDGPTCHRGTTSCFGGIGFEFLSELQSTIDERFEKRPEESYIAKLIAQGSDRMAQKVGEEAVETVIAAKNTDLPALEGEAADLLFHLMVLLKSKGTSLERVVSLLESRHRRG